MGRAAPWPVASALAVVAVLCGPATTRAAVTPACSQMVVTPDFATSRTAFCLSFTPSSANPALTVVATTDGGRSWRRVAATGLVPRADDRQARLLVSTEYANDHALYVLLSGSGAFRSVDGGGTFALADPNGTGFVAATRTVSAGPVVLARRGILLAAIHGIVEGANNSLVVDPPLPRAPVPGTPAYDVAFAAAPDDPSVVLAFGAAGAGASYRVTAFSCTPALSCATPLGTLPARHVLDRVWLSPRFTRDGVLVVRAIDAHFHVAFLRSADGGRTFTPLKSVQRLADAVYAADGIPQSDVAGTVVGGSARLYLRIGTPYYAPAGPPAEQLFVSDDLGTTWRRTAFGRSRGQRGARGTIPDSAEPGTTDEPPGFLTVAGDRMFLAGVRGVLCSTDRGVHWSARCAR